YRYAHNAPQRFAYLGNMMYWLTAHYLGRKHRCSLQRIMRTHYGTDPRTGKKALYISMQKGTKHVYVWNQFPRRLSLFGPLVPGQDVQPLPLAGWKEGHSYEQRQTLLAEAGGRCQHCGQPSATLIVHHPHRLSQVAKRAGHPMPVIH